MTQTFDEKQTRTEAELKRLPVSTMGAEAEGEGGFVCSFSLPSGTGLTMNLRPAEWTTCAVALGGMSEKRNKTHLFT